MLGPITSSTRFIKPCLKNSTFSRIQQAVFELENSSIHCFCQFVGLTKHKAFTMIFKNLMFETLSLSFCYLLFVSNFYHN